MQNLIRPNRPHHKVHSSILDDISRKCPRNCTFSASIESTKLRRNILERTPQDAEREISMWTDPQVRNAENKRRSEQSPRGNEPTKRNFCGQFTKKPSRLCRTARACQSHAATVADCHVRGSWNTKKYADVYVAQKCSKL